MRSSILATLILVLPLGCKETSNPVAPVTSPSSIGEVKDNVLYTFSVSKDTLGILDTLTMTLSASNLALEPDTLYTSDYYYVWSLMSDNGRVISSGPTVLSNLILQVLLNPHQSAVLYRLNYPMADLFGAPITAGSYELRWSLTIGLSFQLSLSCGKSKNEITDSSGITSSIYPLKVGNKWTFRTSYILGDGTVLVGDTVTQTIVGEELMSGEKWFLLRSTDFVDQLITARQNGIYVYYGDIGAAVLKYKYPSTVGEGYASGYEEWTGAADSLVTFQMTVDSTNEVVSVPKGLYQCYKYHAPEVIAVFGNSSNEIGPEDAFLSTIGPVKRIDNNIIRELISTNF